MSTETRRAEAFRCEAESIAPGVPGGQWPCLRPGLITEIAQRPRRRTGLTDVDVIGEASAQLNSNPHDQRHPFQGPVSAIFLALNRTPFVSTAWN